MNKIFQLLSSHRQTTTTSMNFLVHKARQKTSPHLFSTQHVIWSKILNSFGLKKKILVRWVHFNCSLICTFLIIIFSPVSDLGCQLPPTSSPSFCSPHRFFFFSSSSSPLSVHVHLFPFSTLVEKQDFTTVNSLLSFSADSLTWKFHSNCCAFSSTPHFCSSINFWIIGGISLLKTLEF